MFYATKHKNEHKKGLSPLPFFVLRVNFSCFYKKNKGVI